MHINYRIIGITHLVKPPFSPEQEALGNNVEFIHFDSRHEDGFSATDLERLDAFLVWTPAISNKTIQHLKNCKILVRMGVGFDKIDIAALSTAGIAFSNNPEYGPEDVADTAMGLMLSLQRRLYEHDQNAKGYQQGWQEHHLSPMNQSRKSTVGIVGVGRIGTSVVNRLKPFGYKILGYDPYVPVSHDRAIGYQRVDSLTDLFEVSDIVTMHCPLTDETRGMIDRTLLSAAKPGLIFVNTARGALIDSLDTIHTCLKNDQIAAAGLDVLPVEPPDDHALIQAWRSNEEWLRGRLIITPHNGFYSDNAMYECRYKAAETARLFLEKGIHRNAVSCN